ncbi:MAG: DNA-directed RNA polymerase II subunit rpb4 [Marteilia pararefringens]
MIVVDQNTPPSEKQQQMAAAPKVHNSAPGQNLDDTNSCNVLSRSDLDTLQLPLEFLNSEPITNVDIIFLDDEKLSQQDFQNNDEFDMDVNKNCQKALDFAKSLSHVQSKEIIQSIRLSLMSYNLRSFEIISLINLCPKSAEEAKALIPTLEKKFPDQDLQMILDDMHKKISFHFS